MLTLPLLTLAVQVPIGVLPVGKTNSLANKLFPGHTDQVGVILHPILHIQHVIHLLLYSLLHHMSQPSTQILGEAVGRGHHVGGETAEEAPWRDGGEISYILPW